MKLPGSLAVAVLLIAFLAVRAEALTCPEDGCASVKCDPAITEESCVDGKFERGGSACACCDICRPFSGLNEVCENPSDVPEGLRPYFLCRDPLVCKDGKCSNPRETKS